jgi:multidrug efflux pump
MLSGYSRSLAWVLEHPGPMLIILLLTIGLNFYLIAIIPKGFFPAAGYGSHHRQRARAAGRIVSHHGQLHPATGEVIKADPAVANVIAFTGGGAHRTAAFSISR